MENEALRCRTCGEMFVFAAGERSYYVERRPHALHHCKECRQARKKKPDPYEGWQSTMGG